MLALVGIVIVFGAVIAGYLLEHGQLLVLVQPAEFVIIGGAALGTMIIANPMRSLKAIVKGLIGVLSSSKYNSKTYLETLTMLNDLFSSARKNGVTKLEADIEDPEKSSVFSQYPNFLKDHHAVDFLCDTIRMHLTGGVNAFDLDQMMELDMEVHHEESAEPIHALQTVADSLPGLGIVAAVLGVVITMGALGGPPEEIGHKVAAALVGTFLGILLCYGLFDPLATNMMKKSEEEARYYGCLRAGIISFIKGAPPIMAIEFARRSIPSHIRPSFKQLEESTKGAASVAAAA